MINRVITFKSTAELIADKINNFIKNELNEDEYVMDIKYIKDGERYKQGESGKIELETFVTANVHIRGVEKKMNYKELEKANGLLEEIKEIDFHINRIEHPINHVRITLDDYFIPFNEKYKQKFTAILKEIRDEKLKELNELGVVEDDK